MRTQIIKQFYGTIFLKRMELLIEITKQIFWWFWVENNAVAFEAKRKIE
jgi:hypothetical protein